MTEIPPPSYPMTTQRAEVERALWEALAEVDPEYEWRGEPCRMLTSPRDHQQLLGWLQGRDDVESVIVVLEGGYWRARVRSCSLSTLGYGRSRDPMLALGMAAIGYCLETLKARREGSQ
jgi:hypothetical protein